MLTTCKNTQVNNINLQRDLDKPYGIALYDFPATHSDDLTLKEGDVVELIRKVNDDWLEGRVGSRQGIFPLSFIDIKVPLPGLPENIVTALYAFPGETNEDLSFEVSLQSKLNGKKNLVYV